VDHEEFRDLVAVYVLGAVPADEVADVEGHLQSCVGCCWEALGYSQATVTAMRMSWLGRRPPGGAER
jgi:hypothetical protein